jgi:hypothetical protein
MSYLKVCSPEFSATKTINSGIHRTVAASICFGVLLLSGCAPLPAPVRAEQSGQGYAAPAVSGSSEIRHGQQPREIQTAQQSSAPRDSTKGGSKFSQLHLGMSIKQVNEAIGFPNDTDSHESGKRWIPFYFGNDARRLEALYQNEGCLVFSNGNIFGANAEGELKEIKVDPNGSCFRN